jgi:hypothetical protein
MVHVGAHVTRHKLAAVVAKEALIIVAQHAPFLRTLGDEPRRGVAFDGRCSACGTPPDGDIGIIIDVAP